MEVCLPLQSKVIVNVCLLEDRLRSLAMLQSALEGEKGLPKYAKIVAHCIIEFWQVRSLLVFYEPGLSLFHEIFQQIPRWFSMVIK